MPCSVSSAPRTAASSMPSGTRTRQQRVQLLALGREALEAEHAPARRAAPRGRVAWRAQRASSPSSCTIASASRSA